MLNKYGDNTEPCLTPKFTSKEFAQLQNYSSDVGGNFDRHLTLAVHIGHLMRTVFQFREYSPYANKTSGQCNFTKMPHRRRTWTVLSYTPGGANVHIHLIHASLSTSQRGSRSVQPFCRAYGRVIYFTRAATSALKITKLPLRMGDLDPV